MAMGIRVAAGVALVCAIGAVFAIPRRRTPEASTVLEETRPAANSRWAWSLPRQCFCTRR